MWALIRKDMKINEEKKKEMSKKWIRDMKVKEDNTLVKAGEQQGKKFEVKSELHIQETGMKKYSWQGTRITRVTK